MKLSAEQQNSVLNIVLTEQEEKLCYLIGSVMSLE